MALSQPAQPETQPVELELDAPCELQLSFAGASLDHQEHAGQLVESDESHLDASSMPPPQPPSKKQKKQKSDIGESDNKSVTSSDAPSKTASTSKDLIGVKKFGRGYTRQCKGCQLWFKPEGMASKSSFCSKDKNKLDNLSRLAKAQGKAKWLSEARRDEDKISKILKKYSEMSGDAGTPGGKKQVPRATLFSTLEKTVATSRVMYDTKHRFMPEDAYVKHVTEVLLEGEGRLTKAQATLQWQQWSTLISENPETEEVMWDKKGSGGQLRVAVAIEDNLHLSNIYDRAKEFSSKGKDEKSLTEDQISQRKRQLFVNHDSGHDVDAKAIGQSMVRASGSSTAGNSFCALASELDVDELEPRKDDSPEGIEGSGGEESQEESNVRPQAKAKAKAWPKAKARTEKAESRKGWFDRDTAIASKVRSETTALCGLQVQMSNKLKEAQAQMDEVATKPSESQHEVCVENDTLLRRMTFLEAMLDDDSTKLKELIQQQVTDKSCMEGKDDENGDGQSSWQAQVSRAPPCQSFEDLVTLASIKGSLDDYWKCTSANELRDVARQRTLSRKPITELVGAVNVGIKELKKALTALEQRNAKRNLPPSTATGPGRKRSKTAAVHPSAFEAGLDKGNTFNSIASDALSALSSDQVNLSLPLIVKFTSLAALLSDASIKQSVDSFDAAFARHVKSNEKSNMTKPPEARSKVRAASPLFSAEANDAWASFCTSNFMAHMVPEEVGAVGKSVLHVGVQAGASTGAAEKGWQASLRLSISGTKTILACSAETAIATFGVMDPTALWQKFLQMSPEDVQRMVDLQRKEITLWAGTVGPNELFYLPAGWMFAESVLPKADCMGILCRGVINEGSAYNQLQAIRKLLSSVKKNDAELDAVVAALAALEKRALASTVPTEPEPAALASPWPKPSPGESASPSGKKADDVDDVEAHGGGSEIPVEQLAAQDSQSQQLTA